jgi:hypothetical protein
MRRMISNLKKARKKVMMKNKNMKPWKSKVEALKNQRMKGIIKVIS